MKIEGHLPGVTCVEIRVVEGQLQKDGFVKAEPTGAGHATVILESGGLGASSFQVMPARYESELSDDFYAEDFAS